MEETELGTLRLRVDGGVAWAAIDHPPVNLLDVALFTDLHQVLGLVEADPALSVLVLTSAVDGFFVAHADVELILQLPSQPTDMDHPSWAADLLDGLRRSRCCTIAVLDGAARGGGSELALACDLRFASPRAVLCQPEVPLGIVPGAGATQRLPRLVGRARALEVILGGEDVSAEEAAAIGYVNRVLPAEELAPFVDRFARRVAAMPPEVVALAKRAVDAAVGQPVAGLTVEGNAFATTIDLGHHRARMEAFLAAGGQTPEGEADFGRLIDDVLEA